MPDPEAALVPEFKVDDLRRSLAFYVDLLGFTVRYDRPEERFAFIEREDAQLMLEEHGARSFVVDELTHPYGRGMHLQIAVRDVDALYARVLVSGAPIHLALEEKWYRRAQRLLGNRQFVVEDPDGYLLRFFGDIGSKPID